MNDIVSEGNAALLERVVIAGDLSKLTPQDRTQYYAAVCQSVGLNPLTRPFEYIQLNGRLVLYARRDATDQLRSLKGVSIEIRSRDKVDDLYVVTARAIDKSGRTDEALGAVLLGELKGEARANAMMKAETKAKRRVTLSICGLGLMDETEIDTATAEERDDTLKESKKSVAREAWESMDLDKQIELMKIVTKVRAIYSGKEDGQGVNAATALWEHETAELEGDEKIAAWSQFPSDERRAIKKVQAAARRTKNIAAIEAGMKQGQA